MVGLWSTYAASTLIYVHDIQLTNPVVQEKLRYFADYFNFAAITIGKMERIALDNHNSILSKLLFHLGQRKDRRRECVEAYLTHPLWGRIQLISGFKAYPGFERVRRDFPTAESNSKKKDWIDMNERILTQKASSLLRTLNQHLFRKALDTIVARMFCRCNLSTHQEEIEELTRTLVSQYVFDGNSREDIVELFRRIIMRDAKDYPFPKSIAGKSIEEKQQYLDKLKLPAMLRSVHHHLQRDGRHDVHLFRLIGITAANDFLFTYVKVTFIHPKHPKLAKIVEQFKKDKFRKDFFDREDFLLATVRAKHSSLTEARLHAVEAVKSEMEYLKAHVGDQFYLETRSHLATQDYSRAWGTISFDKGLTRIHNMDRDRLLNTPHRLLRKVAGSAKKLVLKNEPLFIKASTSRLPNDCWRYIEAMLKPLDEGSGGIRRAAVEILHSDQLRIEQRHLHSYLINATSSLATSLELLGLTKEVAQKINRTPYSNEEEFIRLVEEHVSTPIVKRIIQLYRDPVPSSTAYLNLLLLECLGQRNAMTHSNDFHGPSMIGCKRTAVSLASRLRASIVRMIHANPRMGYREILEKCGAA